MLLFFFICLVIFSCLFMFKNLRVRLNLKENSLSFSPVVLSFPH